MGFGTLLIGVFLLFNLKAPRFTDLLAGVIILLAFYKLRDINRYFKAAIIPTAIFCVLGLAEFTQEVIYICSGIVINLEEYLAPARFLIIGAMLVLLHYGINHVSREVDLKKTAIGSKVFAIFAYPVFVFLTIASIQYLIFGEQLAIVILCLVALLLLMALLIATLIIIYSAYSNICMPGEENKEYVEKPSRFGFVNRFRERQEQKNREYTEYRLGQMKKRIDRSKLKINKIKKKKK